VLHNVLREKRFRRRGREAPVPEPKGPCTPYPVDDPGIVEQPGADPDIIPGTPVQPGRQR
jgi:hypothetical protein